MRNKIAIFAFSFILATQSLMGEDGILVELKCLESRSVEGEYSLKWDARFVVLRQFSGNVDLVGVEFEDRLDSNTRSDQSVPLGHIWKAGDLGLWFLKSTNTGVEVDYATSNYIQGTGVPIPIPKNPIKRYYSTTYDEFLEWARVFDKLRYLRSGDELVQAYEAYGDRGLYVRYWILHQLELLVDKRQYSGEGIQPLLDEVEGIRGIMRERREKTKSEISVAESENEQSESTPATTDGPEEASPSGSSSRPPLYMIAAALFALVIGIIWIRRKNVSR